MYTIHHYTGTVTRDSDGQIVAPAQSVTDPDYAAYIAWVSAGGLPAQDHAIPPAVPPAVDMRQARLALLGAGLLTAVNEAIAVMPGMEGDAARIEWEFAAKVRRDSQLVNGLAGALGWNDAQLDALFIAAESL